MLNRISIYFFLILISVSCRSFDYSETIYFSEYFPLEINDTKEYFVTNIAHTSFGKDTSYYFLKEVLSEEFIDSEDDLAYRMERFWKTDSTQDYSIKDIWHVKKTLRSAEKVEENERFVKMIFPLNKNSFWNGNAYNSRDYQEYTIGQLNGEFSINNFNFDSSVTIVQHFNSNLLEYESSKEVYAMDVGLIYKENIILNINNGNILDVNYGSEYTQELINY